MADLTIKDVRAKFPQYADMPDDVLAGALHRKFYADMPQADFYAKIGLGTAEPATAAPQAIPAPQTFTPPSEVDAGGFDQQLVKMLAYGGGQAPPRDFSSPAPNREQAYRNAAHVVPMAPRAPVAPSVDPLIAALTGIATAEPPTQMIGREPDDPLTGQPATEQNPVQFMDDRIAAQNLEEQYQAQGRAPYDTIQDATGAALRNTPERLTIGAVGNIKEMGERGILEALAEIKGAKAGIGSRAYPDPAARLKAGREHLLTAQRQRAFAQQTIDDANASMEPSNPRPGLSTVVSGAIGSTADMAPGLVAAFLTKSPAPMMAYMGAYSRGSSYEQGRSEGLAPKEAAEYANLYAAAEAIPEYLPLEIMLRPGASFLKKTFGGATAEAVQETFTEAIQIGIDEGYLSPDMTWAQAKDRLINAGATGGVAGLMMGGGISLAENGVDLAKRAMNVPGNPNAAGLNRAATGKPSSPPPAVDPLLAALMPAPEAEAAPVVPESAPAPTVNAPQKPAAPPAEDRFEVMDEVENDADGKPRPTGRQVRVDKETGQVSVIDANEAAGQPASATGEADLAGKQPQVDATVVGAEVTPAADAPASEAVTTPEKPRYKNQPRNVEFLDETDIQNVQTDATTMQYKAGGDETGVTERLKGITEWKPERAGMSLIYEYADGRRVIADGHQRLGLAKRLASEGKPVQMPATILRETDGVTPAEARVAAALKNIAEGSGTAIDAAKVLRQTDQTPQQLGLPPNSALVRDAAGMRNLSDTAFGMVVNGKASERDGGIVGRLVTDKAAQENILALLNRLKPENAFQAETIVRQAAAETVTETQTSLFGDEQVQANLYLERAKVLDGAMKRVRDEEKAFKTIVEQADTFTEAGNVLDANANEDRLASGGKVRNYLASQANMKGPISDALSAAARSLKDGKRIGTVTSEFLAAVTRGVEGNGQSGQDSNPAGRAPEQTGSAKSQPESEVAPDQGADLFGAPQDDPQADLLNMMAGKPPEKPAPKPAPAATKPAAQGGRPQTDLFDQGDNSQPGERQTDIEDLIAEKEKAPEPDPTEAYLEKSKAIVRGLTNEDDPPAPGVSTVYTEAGRKLVANLARAKTDSARRAIADAYVLEEGKRTGVEHAVLLDNDGYLIEATKGTAGNVNFSKASYRAIYAGRISYGTHNHPSSRALSAGDMVMSMLGIETVIAMGHNGTRHHLALPTDGIMRTMSWEEIKELQDDMSDAMLPGLTERFEAGEITQDVINATYSEILTLAFEKQGLIDYVGTSAETLKEHGVSFDDYYPAIRVATELWFRRAGHNLPTERNSGGNQAAESVQADGAGRDGSATSVDEVDGALPENSDGEGRLPAGLTKDAAPKDDFEGALDDLFGEETSDVQRTGGDLEPDSGNGAPADGVGGANVSAPGRPDAGSGQQGTGPSGGANGKSDSGGGVPGDNAAPVGGQGNPAVSGKGRPARKSAAAGNSGRRNGGGNGGLPSVASGAKAASGDASAQPGSGNGRTAADRASDLNDLFGEPGPLGGLHEEGPLQLDPRKYDRAVAIFNEQLEGTDTRAMTQRELYAAMLKPLVDAGLTREAVRAMKPYVDQYIADRESGRIGPPETPEEKPIKADDRAERQAKADKIRPIPVDQENIRATLPLLLPEQQDDVFKVETRYAKPNGHGMMLTNGTGTGKTYSGAGVIKRFLRQGKKDILIVAPSEAVILGWTQAAEAMGITVNKLKDTKDGGTGVTITTYANMQQNNELAKRTWDLVVTDEAQNLSMNATGDATRALDVLRAITHRPQDLWRKSDMMHAADWERLEAMKDGEAKTAVAHRLFERRKADVEKLAAQPRAKVLFLSATPFAYDKTVDYGEGYLFDYPKDGRIGNSNQGGQAIFMVQNFGYRIRYHKLTKPETAVDSAVFEREFHEKLVREGVLSGRSLHVDVDYDRKFVLREDAQGTQIDTAMELIRKKSTNDTELGRAFQALEQHVRKAFTYHRRQQLLEAIKARMAVADIKKHLPMGRKVVVFHDFNVGGGFNPFASSDKVFITPEAATAYGVLVKENPWVAKLNFAGYLPPREAILQAFGDRAREFNGTVPQKKRLQALTDFNKDGSGVDVLVVQADAGGAGISMHDLTGNHQRVLINLGMPTKPTTTLQEEGRILRVGTMTNAPFRYYTIGTSWERHAFATRIAERSGTVENLALGNQARALREGFIDAYMEAEDFAPSATDGTGGKERDRATAVTSPYDRAKTHYFGRAKMKGKRDQRDGIDFFPTPEPLAFKMVEWAGLRPNERVLEPSAGDGAIARYMPEDIDLTMVEPSSSLASTALLRAPQGKTVDSTFENYHIVNKHHVIVMNPPFGSGGKTAFDHVAKAMKHLRDGGRIVALVPTGPAADKRWNDLWHSDAAKEFNWTADVAMPAVTFERAGTGVMSRVLILDRIGSESERGAWGSGMGGTERVNMTGSEKIEQFFDRLEGISVPRRPEPKVDVIEELEAEAVDATTPPARVTISAPMAAEVGAFALKQTVHAKNGGDLFVAVPENRVERDTYNAMLAVAKTHGGWYSSFRGNGAIPGFQFKSEAGRAAFVEDMAKPVQGLEEPGDLAKPSIYFSPLVRAVRGAKQESASPADWLSILPKLPGVKKAELDWTGVLDFLEEGKSLGWRQVKRSDLVGVIEESSLPDFGASRLARSDAVRAMPLLTAINSALRVGAINQTFADRLMRLRDEGTSSESLLGDLVTTIADADLKTMTPDILADPVWSVEITDELRASAGGEIGLFEPTPPRLVRESKAATEDIARQMPALRRELDRLDLKRVRLAQDTGADWQARFVVTGDGAMEITIGASLDPMKSLHHEVIHALRTMNLFTVDEWRALSLAARKDWIKKHDIFERYPSLTEWEQIEEAIAEEFAEALEAKRAPKGSLLINAFNKIARVFRAFRNVLNGAGYQTPEDIFGRVLAGEITKRNAGNTGAGAFDSAAPRISYQRAKTITPHIADQVSKTLAGKKLDTPIVTAGSPQVISALLGKDAPLVIPQWVIWKANADKHDMTEPHIIEALNGLDNPVMVFDSDTAKDSLVVLVDVAGIDRPVVIAMHYNEKVGRIEIVRVASVHPRRENSHVTNWMNKGLLRYINKQKADAWSRSRGLQLPKDGTTKHRLNKKILQHRDVFKAEPSGLSDSAKYQRPRAVKPLTAQARAHRNTGMQGPLFIPDRRVWESLTQAGAPIWQRLREGRDGASDAVDRARIVIQDRFLPMLRAQEVIENTLGHRLPDEQNAYLRETTFSGKVGRHLFEIDEDFTKPIIDIIASTNGGLTADDVGTWLYARHAIERNARIASINLKMPDGGSGMTDAEAQSILAQAAASPHAARFLAIGAKVDELRERTLKLREEKGLITPAEAQMWRTMYKHYVPLKGFAETDHSEATLDVGGIGNRLNVRGAESKRALGRQSEAFNPLQAAITQAQEASIRAEKNWVGQSIFELARDFPSAALWSVKQPKQKQYYNRTTGLVETRVEDPLSMILEPNEMAVKVKGKEVRILFHDERLARAAGTVGADQMAGIMRVLSMMSRFFSLTRTMLNPEFLVTNAFRDFQTAQFNIQAFGEGDKAKIAVAMVKNWRKAFMGAMRGQKNAANDEWSKNYRAFQKAGGQVSFWTMENPVAAKEDLDHRISLARGNKAARALKVMTSPRALFSMRDNAVLDFIERSNLAVDNAIRLAAFTEARRLGWTEQDAAFLSKELTVNFNRRGEAGPTMNALYPFFNAAVQGSVRTLKAVSSKRVAKLVALAFTAGMLNDLLNAALSDDDDDGEKLYDKVPDFRSQRNFHLVLWGTGDNPIAIPMPYGYNLFPYAGQQLGKVARGVKSPEEAFADVVATAFGAFSPISGNDIYSALMPTMADPLLDMARNENWLGNPIYPKEWGGENFTPDSHLFFSTATEVSKWVAQTMNAMTGGDDLKSGAIDVSPETLDYMAAFVTGSAGAFWGRSFDVMAKTLSGNFDEIERRNVPFLRTVTTPVNEWQDRDRYYQFGSRVKGAEHDRKAYVASSRPVPDNVKVLADLYPSLLAAERERKGQGEWNPKKAGTTPPRDSDKVIMDFNRKYLRVMGRQAE